MEPAAPPFTQPELLSLYARRHGTVHKDDGVNVQQTALSLGRNERRIRRALGIDPSGNATLHWDEAWTIFVSLGWINEAAVRRDVRAAQRGAARVEAQAAEVSARAVRERQRRGA